jgi:hypothetical protein
LYSELERLHGPGLVRRHGDDRTTSYSLTRAGTTTLTRWLHDSPVGSPVLKHPVALPLLGDLVDPGVVREALEATFAARQLQDPSWEGIVAKLIGLTLVAQNEHETGLQWLANPGTMARRVTDSYPGSRDIPLAQAQAGAARGGMADLLDRGERLLGQAGGAKNSSAIPSGSRKDRPEP